MERKEAGVPILAVSATDGHQKAKTRLVWSIVLISSVCFNPLHFEIKSFNLIPVKHSISGMLYSYFQHHKPGERELTLQEIIAMAPFCHAQGTGQRWIAAVENHSLTLAF